MRRHHHADYSPTPQEQGERSDWTTFKRLIPYLWRYKWRVGLALAFMVGAKLANVGVPVLLKSLVDNMTVTPIHLVLAVPIGLLLGYGGLRLTTSLLTELRELVFAKATESTTRSISLEVFRHLHDLSLRFHLERQTGGMTRDIERGTRAIHSLISFSLYSIVPTLIEMILVLTLLATRFDQWFAAITLVALVLYISYTVMVTEWRTRFRQQMNELDSKAHSKAVDSLLNYETVKYFNNEDYETKRYDQNLDSYRHAAIKSQRTLSILNAGQQLIISAALVAVLWRATIGVVEGRLTLGDLVMINAFMLQLYLPLNFLGVMYREIKQSLGDLSKMFILLERTREVADAPAASVLKLNGAPTLHFENVWFSYEPERPILHGISFDIPAGKTVAVVGDSGSGKSTLARLIYRFYDIQSGTIQINGQDIRGITQHSLRTNIGIVPQDTVLFNDTIAYNIGYGNTQATQTQIEQAAQAARIHDFVMSTPKGYATLVGERGLKLSGGEKQRVAIARTLLKNPSLLIFDEATSALDTANERAIQAQIHNLTHNKTTLVIAHRLSTVIDAHEILVMHKGRIVERGSHMELVSQQGRYSKMWRMQMQQDKSKTFENALDPTKAQVQSASIELMS